MTHTQNLSNIMANFGSNWIFLSSAIVATFCLLTTMTTATTPPPVEAMTEVMTAVVTEIDAIVTEPEFLPNTTLPVLNTTLGLVSGKALTAVNGKVVFAYLGIPYAAPPKGDLRFAKPQLAEPWIDTKEAVDYGPVCPQGPNPFGGPSAEEDCLSLNIFVPQVFHSNPLPIMINIPGGGFVVAGSVTDPGENLAAIGELIVVSFNYRLGVFGFLSTNDDCARGNWGLWDQHLAIQWVKDNAARFGGDPNQITILGKSSGANSVLYQALSPQNSLEMFQRVIAQSPVMFNYRSTDPKAGASLTQMLAKELGYDDDDDATDSKDILEFLRDQSTEDLMSGYGTLQSEGVPIRFYPVTDDEFLRGDDLFDTDVDITQYDLIIGYNSGDTSLQYGRNSDPSYTKEEYINAVEGHVSALCRDYDECKGRDLAVQAIIFAYNNIQDLNNNETENFARAVEIAQDSSFDSFAAFIARLHQAGGGNTYTYKFTYEDTQFDPINAPPEVHPRPGHLEDLYYVFGKEPMFSSGTIDQQALSLAFMQYFTNFAKTG